MKPIDPGEIEDFVEISCVIEKDDGTVELDTKMLDSEKMLKILKNTLVKDGLSEDLVEVKYEGRRKKVKPGAMEWVTQLVGGRQRTELSKQGSEGKARYIEMHRM